MSASAPQLDDRLHARRESFDRIPVIDIGPLRGDGDRQKTAREIAWALSNVGFMYVRNHGVDPGLIERTFTCAKNFFALPENEKMALHVSRSGRTLRGYIEPFGENTDPARTKDLKEAYDIGPETPGVDTPFFGANPWPAESVLPGFRDTVYSYHEALRALSRRILGGIALSLDLAEDHFEELMAEPICIQRLLHYPPQQGVIDERIIGIGAHTDYGCLTILAQDEVGGLQVMNRDKEWIAAPPIPDTFVINIGDLIQRLTNDRYIANLHRVVNDTGRERYSIPFFIDADYDAVIAPLPSCVDAATPSRYAPVTCGQHKFSRFLDSYPHLAADARPAD